MQRGLWARALGVAATAGSALGQTVEFRVVERQGQTAIMSPPGTTATTDAVLNLAVQARVVGGTNVGLGNFAFRMRVVGEPEVNGTLAFLLTSNANGTYALNAAQSMNATVGRGGLAAPYAYLAGITGGFFNGLINVSGGSFTNGPDQEILAITGSPTGLSMLLVTDAGEDGNPDTYVGPTQPAANATAALDPAVANTYFATNGNWIDVYRFRYSVSNTLTQRVLRFAIDNGAGGAPQAQVFSRWVYANGVWGPGEPTNAAVTVAPLDVPVGSAVFGACCQRDVCAVLEESMCWTVFGQFRGEGAACLPAGAFNACCTGNYDGANGIEVQDIFAFLNSWFAGQFRADIDQSDTLEVADIFGFITVWMSGC